MMDRSTKIIVELLGKGTMTQSEIAHTFDVSSSAISQIAEKYDEQISKVGAEAKLAKLGTDAKIDKLEATLLDSIEQRLPYETDLRTLAAMFKIMNSAHRRGRGEMPVGENATTTVLQLNQNFIQNNITHIKDAHGQIVQVGDTQLATASAASVRTMAKVHTLASLGDSPLAAQK